MSEANAVMALQNAWNGVIAASAEVEKLAPAVAGLATTTPVDTLDLETYRKATLAQSIAVMALYGVVEELQRKRDAGKQV
jgi:hypothetical protein